MQIRPAKGSPVASACHILKRKQCTRLMWSLIPHLPLVMFILLPCCAGQRNKLTSWLQKGSNKREVDGSLKPSLPQRPQQSSGSSKRPRKGSPANACGDSPQRPSLEELLQSPSP